jgi:hypothetical protein
MQPMPESFPDVVLQALRDWHMSQLDALPWHTFVSLTQTSTDQGAWSQLEWSQAIKKCILEGLQTLQVEDDRAASLLRQRFLDNDPVRVVANRLNVSQSRVLQRQRSAVVALAGCLWQEEARALAARQARILDRLEITAPVRLFGVSDKQAELLSLLGEGSSWIIAVDGMGGIGKTTLVDAAIRQIVTQPLYVDVVWISARRNLFTLWGGLQERVDEPALTHERLLDAILGQLGAERAMHLSYEDKLAEVKERLRSRPHLIVVDNLETAADHEALVPRLYELCDPSRFLLTGRHSLRAFPSVYSLTLNELSLADSLELLRYEAGERGFHELARASHDALTQVYEVVGGNPLVLKLVVGQAFALPLPQVLKNLRLARVRVAEELYRHLYWHSWQALSDQARRVLVTMPLITEQGGDVAQIAAISGLAEEVVAEVMGELVSVSLVNRVGDVQHYRFSIHSLTETFLVQEVLKWQSPP